MLKIPTFKTKKELFNFLIEEKESLISQKCSAIKLADGFGATSIVQKDLRASKSSEPNEQNQTEIQIKAVINTTNLFDSHKDVHLPGLWDKSLQENKRLMHVQEHKSYEFDKIISSGNDLEASTKTYSWKELGYNADGETQALVFDSNVKKSRNKQMFELYKQGLVDNHSVGMRYVKIKMAINDEDYPEEKALWDDNINKVINKEDAEKSGYMWLVYEAKVIEGSAVPNGSNFVTPTLEQKTFVGDRNGEMDSEEVKAMKQFLGLD